MIQIKEEINGEDVVVMTLDDTPGNRVWAQERCDAGKKQGRDMWWVAE